uniref:Uncharacterized protein n=1 Tax=Brassica oleracea TaxID=3712 RepID=A0A3P6GMD6_BRAOL|nr:unnamed protein product [Brassica oleracea]
MQRQLRLTDQECTRSVSSSGAERETRTKVEFVKDGSRFTSVNGQIGLMGLSDAEMLAGPLHSGTPILKKEVPGVEVGNSIIRVYFSSLLFNQHHTRARERERSERVRSRTYTKAMRRSFPSKEFYQDALEDGADIELRQLLTDINTVALVRFSFPICMKGKSLNIRDKLVLEFKEMVGAEAGKVVDISTLLMGFREWRRMLQYFHASGLTIKGK